MIRQKNGKRIIAAALVVALAGGMAQSTGASAIQDAKDKINEANQQLDQTKSQISDIEKKQNSLQQEIDSLDSELVALLLDIEVLKDEISQKEADIDQATSDLAEAEETAQKQYESMKKRIRFMYERGDNALIESLLGAGSMADFLNRVEYFNQIYDYDRTMLNEYQDTITQVAELKETLEQEQQDMLALKENQEHQSEELQDMLTKKRATMDDFDTKLAKAEALAAQYKETIQEQNNIIVAEQARIAAEEEERRRQEEERRRQEEERRRQEAAQQQQQQQGGGSGSSSGDDGGANPGYQTNISGQTVVDFAMQFVGNPYVWGGTSLTKGADCSGFVLSVFKKFGVSLTHSSRAQATEGTKISASDLKPGDLVFYGNGSGTINHVAIYIGGGQVIHASSPKTGIKISKYNYRTPVKCVRILKI